MSMFIKRDVANIVLYSLGGLISLFGTSIYTFAIGLYVLKLTGSGLSFAITLILGTLPIVITTPFTGVLADKLDRKAIIVAMDVFNGFLLLGLYLLSNIYGLTLMMIYVTTFIMTSFITFFNITYTAAIPDIVFADKLMNVNSITKIIQSTSTILGPIIGGLVYVFVDIKLIILINGISFLVSALLELFIDFKLNIKNKEAKQVKFNFMQEFKAGINYMVSRKELIYLYKLFIYINFFLGFSVMVPLPFIINNILKLPSIYFGIIEGTVPVGIIAGALFVNKLTAKLPYNKLLPIVTISLSISIILIGLPLLPFTITINNYIYLLYYSLVMFIFGLIVAFIDIPIIYILQSIVPEEYRGRVIGLIMSIVRIITPIAFLLSGLLINILPAFLLPIFGGIILLIIGITFINPKKLANLQV